MTLATPFDFATDLESIHAEVAAADMAHGSSWIEIATRCWKHVQECLGDLPATAGATVRQATRSEAVLRIGSVALDCDNDKQSADMTNRLIKVAEFAAKSPGLSGAGFKLETLMKVFSPLVEHIADGNGNLDPLVDPDTLERAGLLYQAIADGHIRPTASNAKAMFDYAYTAHSILASEEGPGHAETGDNPEPVAQPDPGDDPEPVKQPESVADSQPDPATLADSAVVVPLCLKGLRNTIEEEGTPSGFRELGAALLLREVQAVVEGFGDLLESYLRKVPIVGENNTHLRSLELLESTVHDKWLELTGQYIGGPSNDDYEPEPVSPIEETTTA